MTFRLSACLALAGFLLLPTASEADSFDGVYIASDATHVDYFNLTESGGVVSGSYMELTKNLNVAGGVSRVYCDVSGSDNGSRAALNLSHGVSTFQEVASDNRTAV